MLQQSLRRIPSRQQPSKRQFGTRATGGSPAHFALGRRLPGVGFAAAVYGQRIYAGHLVACGWSCPDAGTRLCPSAGHQPHARPQPDAAADTDPAALTNGLAHINHYPNRNTRPDGYTHTDRYADPASDSHQHTASYTDFHCYQHPAAAQPHRPSRGCQA